MLKKLIQKGFNLLGYQITKLNHTQSPSPKPSTSYISMSETVALANANGLSVCDYVEKIWNQQGATQQVIDTMKQAQCLENLQSVCEIGPGTGRYIEKILHYQPTITNYVIYETALDWAEWLAETYPIIKRDADGQTLSYEPNNQFDLVHAHGVFVYLKYLYTCLYLKEMVRVTKPLGFIIFDFYQSNHFNPETVDKWINSGHLYAEIIPSQNIEDYMTRYNCKLIKVFENKHGQGYSSYHIYQKQPTK